MRRFTLAAAALMAVAAIFFVATLPPAPARVPVDGVDAGILERTVRGAYHVHTTRSDGAGDKASIAAAARRAGLQFVFLTDHGDGTRPPDPPQRIDGVLLLDGVEISTNGGHYVALDMPQAPYPLGGEAAAVAEDVRRLGGFGIIAHPHHPRTALAWSDWNVLVDGVEWINADAEWRNESALRLSRVLLDYVVRPAPALASVFDRPTRTLDQWNALLPHQVVYGFAAADAHGGARGPAVQEGGSRFAVGPSYEASFRAVSNRVWLMEAFTGDSQRDAERLVKAIRAGRLYSAVDAVAADAIVVPPAPRVPTGTDPGEARLAALPPGAAVTKHQSWWEVSHPDAPGDPPVPWVVVNEGMSLRGRTIHRDPGGHDDWVPARLSGWRIEASPGSHGGVTEAAESLTADYRLRAGERASQFVAVAADFQRPAADLLFTASADRPMRVSVQYRFGDLGRWTQSVYLEPTPRTIRVRRAALVGAERRGSPLPEGPAQSLLFVVDLTNASPGAAGQFTISEIRTALARSPRVP